MLDPLFEEEFPELATHARESYRKTAGLVLSMETDYLRGGWRLPNQPKDTAEYSNHEADHEPSHSSKNAKQRENEDQSTPNLAL